MWAKKSLSGWGRYPVVDAMCARPERPVEAERALSEARGVSPVLAYGLGRSYGDAALIEGGRVVLTRRLNCMLDFDPGTGWVRLEAGVSIEDLVKTFLPRGFFPPVVPGTQYVTVGGALASDIHGKNHHVDGTFADHVRNVDVLIASGEIVRCDAQTEPELFWATVGGQGLTGLVLAMDVQLTPVRSPFIEMESIRVENLDAFFEVSAQSQDFTHTVTWVDSLSTGAAMGRGVLMRGRHAAPDAKPDRDTLGALADALEPIADLKLVESNLLLNRATVAAFNETYYRKSPPGTQRSVVGVRPFFFPLDVVRNWNHVYGRRGFLQYQLVVPPDPDQRAIRACCELFARSGMSSFLTVIKEFGEDAHPYLSFPRPGVTLALDIPNYGQPLLDVMERLDAIVIEAGGRIYLGKDARVPRASFRAMYPEWEDWRAIKDRFDPDQVFQSDLGRRLGLCGNEGG